MLVTDGWSDGVSKRGRMRGTIAALNRVRCQEISPVCSIYSLRERNIRLSENRCLKLEIVWLNGKSMGTKITESKDRVVILTFVKLSHWLQIYNFR